MSAIILQAHEADVTFHNEEYGTEDLQVVRFEGTEGISELFRFVVEVQTDDPNLDLATLVGRPGALLIRGLGDVRRVMGQVSRAEHAGVGVNQARFVFEMVPSVWYLTLRQNCRIFQEKDLETIVTEVLDAAGIPSDRFNFVLNLDHPTREYCVQYRESDWDFISRLLEEEGVFYFFDHTEDGEVLIMGDSEVVPTAISDPSELRFRDAWGHQQDEEVVTSFRYGQSVRPASFTYRDFNFKQPKLNLQSNHPDSNAIHSNLEIYDFPGDYMEKSVGDTRARIRLEEQRTFAKRGLGDGNVKRLTPGFRVSFTGHSREELNREYLITRVVHRGSSANAGEDEGGSGNDDYMNTFEVIPSDVVFRPVRVTPRPAIHGVQTAVVTGPSGEEIYTDEFGRVKVHFHWDRVGVFDERSSCWIRVSQLWAGGQYGSIFTPRIGHEVIVEFEEGDPDRPIITGRVYNNETKVPYTLPDEKTKSTIKTNSSTGGGGYNEIRFEDKAGEEQIFIHAQFDEDIRIENDDGLTVGRDRNQNVGRDLSVKADRDNLVDLGRDQHTKIGGKQAIKISTSYSHDVGGDVIEKYGGAQSTQVTGDIYIKGKSIVIEAGTQLSLKVGGNFVDIGMGGVTIVGTMVKINSGGSAGSGSAGSPVSPTAPTDPAAVPEAGDDSPGEDPSFSGGEPITDPLELAAVNAPWHREEEDHEDSENKTWIEIELVDGAEEPVSGEKYRVILADHETVAEGTTDTEGKAKVNNIDPGQCRVIFPDLDKRTWEAL
jgi:type VI secretion system secreted protein VgrG